MFPPHSKFKLNVDGSSLGNPGSSAGGVVIRDSMGGFVAASALFFGYHSNMHAEVYVLWHGLLLCRSLGLQQVYVESDSNILVTMLAKGESWPWKHYSVLAEISQLIRQGDYTLCHIYSEANRVAHSLAKFGAAFQCSSQFSL